MVADGGEAMAAGTRWTGSWRRLAAVDDVVGSCCSAPHYRAEGDPDVPASMTRGIANSRYCGCGEMLYGLLLW
jgi:hypothetical protein